MAQHEDGPPGWGRGQHGSRWPTSTEQGLALGAEGAWQGPQALESQGRVGILAETRGKGVWPCLTEMGRVGPGPDSVHARSLPGRGDTPGTPGFRPSHIATPTLPGLVTWAESCPRQLEDSGPGDPCGHPPPPRASARLPAELSPCGRKPEGWASCK